MHSYLPVSKRIGATPHWNFANASLCVRGIIVLQYDSGTWLSSTSRRRCMHSTRGRCLRGRQSWQLPRWHRWPSRWQGWLQRNNGIGPHGNDAGTDSGQFWIIWKRLSRQRYVVIWHDKSVCETIPPPPRPPSQDTTYITH
jgi:hypothetical protein